MGQKRKASLQDLIDTLKKESANRSRQHLVKQVAPEPIEHNTIWLLDGKIDEATEIYRFLPFTRLRDIYAANQTSFRQTIKWDDPFENFLFKCSLRDSSGNLVSLEEIAKKWYGQCWTLEKETDALWRIYSGDKNSVRISTTVGKLFRSFYNRRDGSAPITHYMSSVKYLERTAIEDFLRQTSFSSLIGGAQNIQFAALLSVKRIEFGHEREVRLLKCVDNPQGQWLQSGFNANAVIETITFDPRLENSRVMRRTAQLKKIGCGATFEESKLYKLDRIVIKF